MMSKVAVIKGEKPEMTLDIRTFSEEIMSPATTGALTGVPMPRSAGPVVGGQ
jgi:hypothetical protein